MSEVSAQEACKRAGVTYRQFDYWVRRGWIKAVQDNGGGSGNPRAVEWHEVEVLRLMGALVAVGLEPSVACEAARKLRATGFARVGRFVIREVPASDPPPTSRRPQ